MISHGLNLENDRMDGDLKPQGCANGKGRQPPVFGYWKAKTESEPILYKASPLFVVPGSKKCLFSELLIKRERERDRAKHGFSE